MSRKKKSDPDKCAGCGRYPYRTAYMAQMVAERFGGKAEVIPCDQSQFKGYVYHVVEDGTWKDLGG